MNFNVNISTNLKNYYNYQDLIDSYMVELNSVVSNSSGHLRQDTPETRHHLRDIHHKYYELKKELFPHNSGQEFSNLYIEVGHSWVDILDR
jgi:hypothetical protein